MKPIVSRFNQRFRGSSTILMLLLVMSLLVVVWGGSATSVSASSRTTDSALKKGHVVHVSIEEKNHIYYFVPSTIRIRVGDIVVWKNGSDAIHTVTSNTGVFHNKGFLSQGQTFTFTFRLRGTFKYHCAVHPYMHGMIVVTP